MHLCSAIILLILSNVAVSRNISVSADVSSPCCLQLHKAFPNDVSFPNSKIYQNEQTGLPYAGYWTPQESELQPACRFTPTNATSVAKAVKMLASKKCHFAVRGGGHTAYAGAANIDAPGLTIDLSALNHTNVTAGSTIVSVGGGSRWGYVYQALDKLGLAMSGGRVFDVGVGGLTTGGGKSFFSSKRGFTCDSVVNFEIVTGEGKLLNANSTSHPDLFKALKGGSSNFGIVTRFDFQAFKQGNLWGGSVLYSITTIPQQLEAFSKFANATSAIPYPLAGDAEIIISFVNLGFTQIASNFFTYTVPQLQPPVFKDFYAIKNLSDGTKIQPLAALAQDLETGVAHGKRATFSTLSFYEDANFTQALYNMQFAAFKPLANVSGLLAAFTVQALSRASLAHGCGRNALGLCPTRRTLVNLDFSVQWDHAADDARIHAAVQKVLRQGAAMARKAGLFEPYIYLNYAYEAQDPLASYGKESLAAMRKVSRKYDPHQVFQKLVPGGFKLH